MVCSPFAMSFLANYTVMVDEDATIGAEVIRVIATDADSGERGAISFSQSGYMVNTQTHNNNKQLSDNDVIL